MNDLERIEIKIGDSFIVAQQRYCCVKRELQSCLECAFNHVGYEPCEALQCMSSLRTDNTNVCFVKADETK